MAAGIIGGRGVLAQDASGEDVMDGGLKDATGHPHLCQPFGSGFASGNKSQPLKPKLAPNTCVWSFS